MRQLAVFDMANFIWDMSHFNNNRPAYYNVMASLPNIYEGIVKNKIQVAIRGELTEEIFKYFPYAQIPNEFYSFQIATLSFLSNISMLTYPSIDDTSITCIPDLVKVYFEKSTQAEVRYLITFLHNNVDNKQFLSYKIFWNSDKKLAIKNSHNLEIETLLCDEIEQHDKIINSLKKIFEHNPKHDDYKSSEEEYYGDVISSLSCYNERLGNTADAQALLDKSVWFRDGFYCWDEMFETYVKFVHTRDNIYHGYDVVLSKDAEMNLKKVYHK